MTDATQAEALRACPFCGEEGRPVELKGRGVRCERCKAWGPDPASRFVRWDKRPAEAERDRLAALGQRVIALVEGLDGYGTARSDMSGARLKDQPAWVEFYNALHARAEAALVDADRDHLMRALKLAEHDQIDLLNHCRLLESETDDPERKRLRVMRSDAVQSRLEGTRAALTATETQP